MSTVIIIGGGGHAAVKYLSENYHCMTADEKAAAVAMLRDLVQQVNQRFGQNFDTHNL